MSSSRLLYLSACLEDVPDDDAALPLTLMHVCDHYTLVPRALFDAANCGRYLSLNDPPGQDALVLSEGIEGMEADLEFAVPVGINQIVQERFPSVTWTSHVAALCASLVRISGENHASWLGVFVRNHKADFVLAQSGRLMFCNSFSISGPSDILFFALKVSMLHHSPAEVRLCYMAESPELSLQASHILSTRFQHVTVWKSLDDLPFFNLLPVCE